MQTWDLNHESGAKQAFRADVSFYCGESTVLLVSQQEDAGSHPLQAAREPRESTDREWLSPMS